VCIWNRGGGGPKKFGNRCCRVIQVNQEGLKLSGTLQLQTCADDGNLLDEIMEEKWMVC
jgi:hypothetical protein